MNDFDLIKFNGTFRDYQRRVLDNADKYLSDGRINVVAAPGSGKTVLGLELIRRLASPAIILSPTNAIKLQWEARFYDMFTDGTRREGLFSTNLRSLGLITSVTYQALYAASERLVDEGEDYSSEDIWGLIRERSIKTVCLDEAHHLRNEWQKALEKLISVLGGDVKIIALTATPPYDSDDGEWERYTRICGTVDEEIFVPELVANNTLCPHQDYVYFNYPSAEELGAVGEYRREAALAAEEIAAMPFMAELCQKLNSCRDYDELFASAGGYISLLSLFESVGLTVDKKLIRVLTARRGLPRADLAVAERATELLLSGELLDEAQREEVINCLKRHGVYSGGRAKFVADERLRRTLVSSVGKLQSIKDIVKAEKAALGDKLRMLILTDYIRRESLSSVGTDSGFSSVNLVSIFETLRRAGGVKLGVLSGSLIILPEGVKLEVRHRRKKLVGTDYYTAETGDLHDAVAAVGRLFSDGEIDVLIGTKSLLGEGWDSPCINSLILASFVGSFVSSNQMRGRAIRVDRDEPDKTANIWHLVTLEPDYMFDESALGRAAKYLQRDKDRIVSCDYDMLKRRFASFMGPDYETSEVVSVIERVKVISPPFDRAGIERINGKMLALAADRQSVRSRWKGNFSGGSVRVAVETEVGREKRIPQPIFYNFGLVLLITVLQSVVFVQTRISAELSAGGLLLAAALQLIVLALVALGIKKLICALNPARDIARMGKAVAETLRRCGLISGSAYVEVTDDKDLTFVSLRLENASLHDQNVFNAAMTELLSPIENPRYIIVRRGLFGSYDYVCSFACPSDIGRKKEYAAVLAKCLKDFEMRYEAVYTRTEHGRKFILHCRRRSYITYNRKLIDRKYKVTPWK